MSEPLNAPTKAGPAHDAPRHAVYFAPAVGSPWHQFGELWLGGAWRPEGLDGATWQARLQAPRRYGFHATLKAPFRLAADATEAGLLARVAGLAGRLRAVALGEVGPQVFDGYAALSPVAVSAGLQALAAHCVLDLDDLRAPLRPEDLARRQPQRLDERGRALLMAHGYPQVLERFRFHMTLAMCADEAQARAVAACARGLVAALHLQSPLVLDRLCVFREPGPGEPFVRLQDFLLQD